MLHRRQMVRQLKVGAGFKAPGQWATMAGMPAQIDCKKAFRK